MDGSMAPCALVVVDVQGKLAHSMHAKEEFFRQLQILIKGMQLFDIPIFWLEQVPEKLGPTVSEIRPLFGDRKPIVKSVFSCARNETFVERLRGLRVKRVVLAGLETHVCIFQTARDLLQQGYQVEVVADAVASRTAFNKQIGLERIRQEGGFLTSVEMILLELQQAATGDDRFRRLIALIK
jgi:nicotinamidase-related amidase